MTSQRGLKARAVVGREGTSFAARTFSRAMMDRERRST